MNFETGSDQEQNNKLWAFRRFETQLVDIMRCLDFELDDEDLDFEVDLFNDPWSGKPQQTNKSYCKLLDNFECGVVESRQLLENFTIKEMSEFHDRMLSSVYDVLEDHSFFGKHASHALTIMSRHLPFKPEYYLSRIHETDAEFDAEVLPRDAPINLSCSRGKLQFSRHLQRHWTKSDRKIMYGELFRPVLRVKREPHPYP